MTTPSVPGPVPVPVPVAVKASARRTTAEYAFLLLFPGFFFYQTLIGMGAMRAFLGGYFAIVSIGVSLPLGFCYFRALKAAGYRVARTDLQFGFFLVYFFIVVAINAGFGANPAIDQTHLASILYFFNIFVIFKTIDFADSKTRGAAVVTLLLMSVIIFYFSSGGVFRPGLIGDPRSPESVASYQGFARSYLLTLAPVIAFTRSAAVRSLLYCIAVPALFINGSRSELVAAVLLIPLVETYRAKSALHIACFTLLAIAAVTTVLQAVQQGLPENRVWELFNLSQSDSAHTRHGLTQAALRSIAEHPLLGDYANYLAGGYSHNILSAWVDLGLFGFAYLLFLLVPTAFKLLAGSLFMRVKSGDFLLAWSLICISLLLLITAKTFDDMFAGAAMGAYANYRSKRGADTTKSG